MFTCKRCGGNVKSKSINGTHIVFAFMSRCHGLYTISIDHPVCNKCQIEFKNFWGIKHKEEADEKSILRRR